MAAASGSHRASSSIQAIAHLPDWESGDRPTIYCAFLGAFQMPVHLALQRDEVGVPLCSKLRLLTQIKRIGTGLGSHTEPCFRERPTMLRRKVAGVMFQNSAGTA